MGVGLVLGAVFLIEIYFGVAVLALDRGHVLVGFGLALDACARVLGTVAAERDGSSDWSWTCALGGSPFVAGFALWQERGPVLTEPAPLAGVVGLAACVVLGLAIALAILGS
jgi:hypothetical protein